MKTTSMSSFHEEALQTVVNSLTLLHSEQPKLHRVLAVLSATGLIIEFESLENKFFSLRVDPV